MRSRTAPELELRRYSPVSVDGSGKYSRNHRPSPVSGRSADTTAWSNRSQQKSATDASIIGKVIVIYVFQEYLVYI